jgi:hypothetical protein
LLSANGWDPYLEAQGSLWLLHWKLATDTSRGIAWRFAFAVPQVEFDKHLLQNVVERRLEQLRVSTALFTNYLDLAQISLQIMVLESLTGIQEEAV